MLPPSTRSLEICSIDAGPWSRGGPSAAQPMCEILGREVRDQYSNDEFLNNRVKGVS